MRGLMAKHATAVAAAVLLVAAVAASAQAPCTDRDAYAHPGAWVPRVDETLAAPAAVAATADQIRTLLVRSIHQLDGIEAKAYRWAGTGRSRAYGVRALFKGYYCVENTTSYVAAVRGKVRLGDETGTWIDVSVNTLYWLINDFVSAHVRTVAGQTIFFFPHEAGEWRGLTRLRPEIHHSQETEAFIVAPAGQLPYRFVTRQEYLRARERQMDSALQATSPRYAREVTDRQYDLSQLRDTITALTGAEREQVAVVRNPYALPWRERPSRRRDTPPPGFFATEAQGGHRLFVVNADAPPFVTIYLRWDGTPPKAGVIQQFKDNFDLDALRGLLQ